MTRSQAGAAVLEYRGERPAWGGFQPVRHLEVACWETQTGEDSLRDTLRGMLIMLSLGNRPVETQGVGYCLLCPLAIVALDTLTTARNLKVKAKKTRVNLNLIG